MTDKIDNRNLRIVILELEHHAELLKSLYELLSLKNFSVTLLTTPAIYRKTQLEEARLNGSIEVFLRSEDEPVSDFIDRTRCIFESADILYFNTVRHHWRELNSIPLPPVSIARVHNAHCDLAPGSHLYRPLANAIPILFHLISVLLIKGEWSLKKKFFRKIDYVMFPNESITEYVRNQGWLAPEKIMEPMLPFGYLGDKSYESNSSEFRVTLGITGRVTNRKKDYHLVCSAIERCISELHSPIKLVLLGRAGDKEASRIVDEFKKLECDNFILDYSRDYLDSETFEEKISEVDFLISPIQTSIECRRYHEVYGKTKISGIENDVLAFRKPLLVNSGYRVSGKLSYVIDHFDKNSESLAFKIKEWVNHRIFEEKRKCFDDLREYEKEVVAENFYKKCCQLVREKEIASQF